MSNQTDFCGLDEKKANERLAVWLTDKDEVWKYRVVWGGSGGYLSIYKKHAKGVTTGHVETIFTRSLDSCTLIEARLTPEQKREYVRVIQTDVLRRYLNGSFDGTATDSAFEQICADAATRVRALLTVLDLGGKGDG